MPILFQNVLEQVMDGIQRGTDAHMLDMDNNMGKQGHWHLNIKRGNIGHNTLGTCMAWHSSIGASHRAPKGHEHTCRAHRQIAGAKGRQFNQGRAYSGHLSQGPRARAIKKGVESIQGTSIGYSVIYLEPIQGPYQFG